MSQTYTYSATGTREVGSLVMADLRLLNAFYKQPSDADILRYGQEVEVLLEGGHLARVEYGFKRLGGQRVLSLEYRARYDGTLERADPAGSLFARADTTGALFYSYLWYADSWRRLSASDQAAVKRRLLIERTGGDAPSEGAGYWVEDKTYGARGVAMTRRTFRPR